MLSHRVGGDSPPTLSASQPPPHPLWPISAAGTDLVRFQSESSPARPFVRREAGHQQPDRSHGRKTGPFSPGTGAPVLGGGYTQKQRKNSERSPRNPRASSGRRPTATGETPESRPESGDARIGALARARAHARPRRRRRRGRRDGGRRRGEKRRLRSLRDAEQGRLGAERGSCGVSGDVGSGKRGRHKQFRLPLYIIPMAPRSDPRFRAGTIAFSETPH
jgi:hypothetical protein